MRRTLLTVITLDMLPAVALVAVAAWLTPAGNLELVLGDDLVFTWNT